MPKALSIVRELCVVRDHAVLHTPRDNYKLNSVGRAPKMNNCDSRKDGAKRRK